MSDSEEERRGGSVKKHTMTVLPDLPPAWKNWPDLIRHVVKTSLRAFLVTLSVKGGISLFLGLLSRKVKSKSFWEFLKGHFLSEDTLRTAATVGSFAFLWKSIVNALFKITGKHSKANGAIAGAVAGGLSILFESKENRIGYAQNVFFRSLQAGKMALKQRHYWTVPHGDSWLFCLATASIVYAYGYRPETIPRSYYGWLLQKCRVPKASLLAQASHSREMERVGSSHFQVDMKEWKSVFSKTNMIAENVNAFQDIVKANNGQLPSVPCSLYHPTSASCTRHELDLFLAVFKDMFPVYFSLTAIPLAVLNTKKIFKE